jgi:hypothetical protein
MRELLRAELRRLRWIIAAGAVVHLIVLGLFTRVVDLLQQPLLVYQLFGGVYVAVALLLGVWQLRGHRSPSAWLYLLHRPLPPRRIATAVLGAGALGCVVMVAAPMALTLLAQHALTARVVDMRHLGLPVSGALLAIAGYLAGALLVIHPVRHALAVVGLLAWPALAQAAGPAALLVELIAAAWLAALALDAFQPDPDARPRSAAALVRLAAPLAATLSILLTHAASLLFQLGWIVAGSHPLNGPAPTGGYVEASRAPAHALLGREPADGAVTLTVELERFPRRHELTNIAPMELDDDATRWVFSHDAMQLIGIDLATARRRGTLGRDGDGRFEVPPLVGDGVLYDARTMYVLDRKAKRVVPHVIVPAGETLAAPPRVLGDALVVLSDRALALHDARAPGTIRHRVALPLAIGALERVDLVVVDDGYLASIVGGRGSLDGRGEGRHWRLRIGRDGVHVVSERPLAHDFPELLRHREILASPILSWITERAVWLLADPAPLLAAPPRAPGRLSWLVALALSVTAALWTARRSRSIDLPRHRAVGWTLSALVLGWPMAFAFGLVERRP